MARKDGKDDADSSDAMASIAYSIRHIRRGRMSIDDLAKRADVSSGLISLLENGRGNPSVETLTRIARALEVDLGELLQPPPTTSRPTRVVRRGQRTRRHAASSSQEVELLVPDLRHAFTVSEITLEPGESFRAVNEYGSESLLYVSAGRVSISSAASSCELTANDTLLLRSRGEISAENFGDTIATAIAVFRAPAPG